MQTIPDNSLDSLVAPPLAQLLQQLARTAAADRASAEFRFLDSHVPWLQKDGHKFPCLRCPHAIIVIEPGREAAMAVGACKKFVALPRRAEDRPGYELIAMACSGGVESDESGGGGWDSLVHQAAAGGTGEAERDQQPHRSEGPRRG